jgi:hypothetical protein
MDLTPEEAIQVIERAVWFREGTQHYPSIDEINHALAIIKLAVSK